MIRRLVAVWAFSFLLAGVVNAQTEEQPGSGSEQDATASESPAPETEPSAEPPSADAQPTTDTPDDAEPADADGDSPSEPAAEAGADQDFDKLFGEWKALLAQLRELALKYKTAKPEGRPEIKAQYEKLVEQGLALEPHVKAGAEKAYIAAPSANKELGNFLASLVKSDVANDNYEEALRRGEILIDNDFENKRVYGLAGVAAFNTNDFEKAEKYLKIAEENIALDDAGRHDLEVIDEYKAMWAKEKEIREAEAKADDLPRVLLRTNKGDVVVELFENEAPQTVANFVSLVSKGFYDGLTFHRVLPAFMAQGGDPKGDGTGGPGYTIPCECYAENHRLHFRGSLSMAHAGRDSGGSQFFLTFVPTQHLDGKHTVFGRVIEGYDVLGRLQKIDPSQTEASKTEPDKIVEATVLRKRDHDYEPTKTSSKE